MKPTHEHFLKLIYDHEQSTGQHLIVNLDENSETGMEDGKTLSKLGLNVNTFDEDVRYLEKKGFIHNDPYSTSIYCISLTEKGETYVENGFKHQSDIPQPTSNFNISGVNFNNSVVGSIGNNNNISNNDISISTNASLSELESLIATKPAEDQELLQELLATLKSIEHSAKPVKRGFLAKFSGVIEKYTDILTSVGKFFVGIFAND
ncbi:MAG: hypothetical protein HFE90_03260 [Firmicutes bacterium]|nr:hypothetical protein [Bacillota bacterium]